MKTNMKSHKFIECVYIFITSISISMILMIECASTHTQLMENKRVVHETGAPRLIAIVVAFAIAMRQWKFSFIHSREKRANIFPPEKNSNARIVKMFVKIPLFSVRSSLARFLFVHLFCCSLIVSWCCPKAIKTTYVILEYYKIENCL